MARPTRTHISDLRGAAKLAVDASSGITDIVEKMHRTIQMLPGPFGRISPDATRGITGFVYRSVRGGMNLAGKGIDASLAPLLAMLPDEGQSSRTRDAILAALNGAYGDYLVRTSNPLAIEMGFRCEGQWLDVTKPALPPVDGPTPASRRKLLVLLHGLCLNDQHWLREGHDHGAALAAELGYTPLYLRYNSGLRIGANGRTLANSLETLLARWPDPVDEVVLMGHSMGGLVARSAILHASKAGHRWTKPLKKLICLGTPHHGAPLERGGHGLDFLLEISPYSAPFTRIGKSRSVGIMDLRHGTITESGEHEFVPLPAGIRCYAAAATLATKRSLLSEKLVGDGLVPLDSALGQHTDPERTLNFAKCRQWTGYGIGHLQLLNHAEVHGQLRKWLTHGNSHPMTESARQSAALASPG